MVGGRTTRLIGVELFTAADPPVDTFLLNNKELENCCRPGSTIKLPPELLIELSALAGEPGETGPDFG